MSFKYFSRDEFKCSETGNNEIQDEFIHALDKLRESCGFPFAITSGYRDPSHSVEAKKEKAGQHTLGIAADIAVSGGDLLLCPRLWSLGFLESEWLRRLFMLTLEQVSPCYGATKCLYRK